jgi:hypothetical protein
MALAISSRLGCQAIVCKPSAARRLGVVVRAEGGAINPSIKKGKKVWWSMLLLLLLTPTTAACSAVAAADVDKVVDMLKAEDLPKKAVFCRCWRSQKVRLPGGQW